MAEGIQSDVGWIKSDNKCFKTDVSVVEMIVGGVESNVAAIESKEKEFKMNVGGL